VLLILALQHTVDPAMSILVHARQSATVHLPAGRYDMMFSVGNTWCNPRSGFSEGQLLKFDKSLAAQPGKPMQVSIRPSGTGSQNFRVLVRKIRKEPDAAPAYTRDGSMELKRRANGHFYLPGTIGGISATFVVDPGAPVTSISSDLANQAGVTNCKEVQSRNDATGGCVAFLPRMMLDKFVVRNITVAVIPNLEANVLGSDVLRNFTVSRHDDTMLIGKHKSRTRHDRK
jgi:hypothetical protein